MKKKKSAKLGQNFLINKSIAEKIVEQFFPIQEMVVEIGPGKGVLTDMIISKAKSQKTLLDLMVVEIDNELAEKLTNRDYGFRVINKSILNVQPEDFNNKTIQIIGNVPYYISKDIINWIIKNYRFIKSGVLMFQKEFVDKVLNLDNPKTKNAQNLMFNFLFEAKKVISVSPGSFFPIPKVSSSVFKFEKKENISIDVENFYKFLKLCFNNRRKTLLNNLSQSFNKNISKVLEEYNLNKNIRAEELNLNDFINIYILSIK